MLESRAATVERLFTDIAQSRDTGQGLRRRIASLRACGLASPSEIARLERALETRQSEDMWDNVPV
ncbi:hypothetical protein [Oceaniglobus trochenteri]|uniref:hypothetical protein n=1 Tax=Oceaniglobus trochenteri TaxID=2763260 RepID=UPI001CFF8E2A|nr:hypothetical protein [Oceaniglobus trochenteri]